MATVEGLSGRGGAMRRPSPEVVKEVREAQLTLGELRAATAEAQSIAAELRKIADVHLSEKLEIELE